MDTAFGEQGPNFSYTFDLAQNFPNPFNTGTLISYTLDRATEVELDIYSLTGQRVVRLVGEFATAGAYEVVWDGLDDAGRNAASGAYLYRLRTGEVSQVRKLLFLR